VPSRHWAVAPGGGANFPATNTAEQTTATTKAAVRFAVFKPGLLSLGAGGAVNAPVHGSLFSVCYRSSVLLLVVGRGWMMSVVSTYGRWLGAFALVAASLAVIPTAESAQNLNRQALVFQLWLFPTADVTAFNETVNKALGANGWQDKFVAQATTGPIVVRSTVTIYPTAARAHAALVAVSVPDAKLVSRAGGIPAATDDRLFDHLASGRDDWTVYWRSGRVVASLEFSADYIDKTSNVQNCLAYAVRQQKWMVAGGA
jgi:hypothetical protein